MTNRSGNILYNDAPERELEKMWEDIKGNNTKNLSRSLLKDIEKNNAEVKIEPLPREEKQMYDSEEGEWVPFDLIGASEIINGRNEQLRMRIKKPTVAQNEYGAIIYTWEPYDCSYLQNSLKEKVYNFSHMSFLSLQSTEDWIKMIKQDHQELRYEGRYDEIPGRY